jgi:ribulose-5-phosphate 4-epimerase/fuculose-1-phosphate aldolase
MSFTAIKEACFEANLSLFATGLVDLNDGNASVYDHKPGAFALKRSGADARRSYHA